MSTDNDIDFTRENRSVLYMLGQINGKLDAALQQLADNKARIAIVESRIENEIDALEQRHIRAVEPIHTKVQKLEAWRSYLIGIVVASSVFIPFIVDLIKEHVL